MCHQSNKGYMGYGGRPNFACQPACQPACRPACRPVCQPVCQPRYQPTYNRNVCMPQVQPLAYSSSCIQPIRPQMPMQQPCYYNNNAYQSYAPSASNVNVNVSNASYSGGEPTSPFSVDGFSAQLPAPFDLSQVQLPQPNLSCYAGPQLSQGQVRYVKHQPQSETKCIQQQFNLNKTAVKDNVVHHQHQKNVVINVNRTHNHHLKVINKDTNYHHHLINNVVRVNDIHHQKIEQVRGEGRTLKDYKQVHRIEQPVCRQNENFTPEPPVLSYTPQPQQQDDDQLAANSGYQHQQDQPISQARASSVFNQAYEQAQSNEYDQQFN